MKARAVLAIAVGAVAALGLAILVGRKGIGKDVTPSKRGSQPSRVTGMRVSVEDRIGIGHGSIALHALSSRGSEASISLANADRFDAAHVGFVAALSWQASAFRDLMAEKEADMAFKEMVIRGTTAGQLYGLAGVYFTDRPALEGLAATIQDQNQSVSRSSDCFLDFPYRVGDLIASPAKPHFDIVHGAIPDDLLGQSIKP